MSKAQDAAVSSEKINKLLGVFKWDAEISSNVKRLAALCFILFLGFLGGVVVLAYATAGSLYEYRDTVYTKEALPEVDAIVCLAGGRGRIQLAADIWYRYWQDSEKSKEVNRSPNRSDPDRPVKLPILMISGMGEKSDWGVFTRQVREPVKRVLRLNDVVLETKSQDTIENAFATIEEAKAKQWRKILLITSSYHMKRSALIFERLFRANFPQEPTRVERLSLVQQPYSKSQWQTEGYSIQTTVWEYLKWVYSKAFWTPKVATL